MTAGLPMIVPASASTPACRHRSGRGEDAVVVAGQDDVDAVDGGQRDRGVFHHVGVIRRADAGMAERDDDLGPFLAHLRHVGLRRSTMSRA
jgi:hypothetical protein